MSTKDLDPPGFVAKKEHPFILASDATSSTDVRMYEARASEIARGQLGGVFQTAFTLYMFVGNQLQLFNMMFLFTFGMGPINNLLALEKSFAAVSVPGANIFMSKLMYIGLNLAGLAVVIWKIRSMGLLPLTSADWVSLLPDKFSTQISSAPELLG